MIAAVASARPLTSGPIRRVSPGPSRSIASAWAVKSLISLTSANPHFFAMRRSENPQPSLLVKLTLPLWIGPAAAITARCGRLPFNRFR